MWVNSKLFNLLMATNTIAQDALLKERAQSAAVLGRNSELSNQKIRDDITIDWMRHRINALEKVNAQLLNKAAGIFVPVPEIVPTRPGTISEIPDFDSMPSFEDVGDSEAVRLGITHTEDGSISYTK